MIAQMTLALTFVLFVPISIHAEGDDQVDQRLQNLECQMVLNAISNKADLDAVTLAEVEQMHIVQMVFV